MNDFLDRKLVDSKIQGTGFLVDKNVFGAKVTLE